jgi:ankyrin repeat protein
MFHTQKQTAKLSETESSHFFQHIDDAKYIFSKIIDYLDHENMNITLKTIQNGDYNEILEMENSQTNFKINQPQTYIFNPIKICHNAEILKKYFHDSSNLSSRQIITSFINYDNDSLLLPGFIHVSNRIKLCKILEKHGLSTEIRKYLETFPNAFVYNREFINRIISKTIIVHDLYEPLRKGGDIDTKDISGLTPLHLAIMRDHFRYVHFVLKNGANVNLKSDSGKTPLIYAARNGNVEIIQELIKFGANINDEDSDGNTALHHAARFDDLEIIQCLIHYNADPSQKNNKGKTPSDLAVSYSFYKNFDVLKEKYPYRILK